LEAHRARGGVPVAFVAGGSGAGLPEIGEGEARHRRHLFHVGRLAVGDEGGAPLRVVPGEHAARAPDHAMASLGAITLRALTPASGARRKSQSSLRNGLGMPRRFASAASSTLRYLP